MSWIVDPDRVAVYAESRKRRQRAGVLSRDPRTGRFRFEYDPAYLRSPRAIPLGPELSLAHPFYESDTIFPAFADRIPSRANPAYAEYCAATGISPEEVDPMALLPAIARRGPSSFIFEKVWKEDRPVLERLKTFRADTGLSLHDLAQLLEVPVLTLKRFENGQSRRDAALTGLLRALLDSREILASVLRSRGAVLHDDTRRRLEAYSTRG